MLVELAQRAVAIGWVYDLSQTMAGAHLVRRRLRRHLAELCQFPDRILDIGGGTGKLQGLTPSGCRYFCLDIERPKLIRYVQVNQSPNPLLADATQMPVRTASIDLIVWVFIAHHLSDEMLKAALDETGRVLKDDGHILFLDPVFSSRRWPGRLLWKLDRGSYPRTEENLRSVFNSCFHMEEWHQFAIYHRYLLGVGRKLN
jgi:ubiquinone/menaquinone biosynthesis C-methylase UbiE